MSKTIDVEAGDTFTITPGAACVDVYRDGKCVAIYYQNGTFHESCATGRAALEQDVSRHVAQSILQRIGWIAGSEYRWIKHELERPNV